MIGFVEVHCAELSAIRICSRSGILYFYILHMLSVKYMILRWSSSDNTVFVYSYHFFI